MNRKSKAWTAEDDEKIRSLAGKVPLSQIARKLNRTEGATGVQASKLRISVRLGSSAAIIDTHVEEQPPEAAQVEVVVGPSAIERALSIYQQLQRRDRSVLAQARKILTQHIYGLIDQGEYNEHRLTVGGLARLKAVERDHDIKSANEVVPSKDTSSAVTKSV